jgi:hypothetical protein
MKELSREFFQKGNEICVKPTTCWITTMKARLAEPEVVTRKGKPAALSRDLHPVRFEP